MGKYSENPIDDIQGYLSNIEMVLERMEKQQKEQAAVPPQSADDSELESIKGELSSIRTAIDEIRKDNGLVSASMNTVAEAIGTVPTDDERKRQHQEDLEFVVNNAKKQVTVDLEPEIKVFEQRIGKFIDGKLAKASRNMESSVYENWFWRALFLIAGIAYFVIWLWPKIEDVHFPSGPLGVLCAVIGIVTTPLIFVAVYKWGKSNGGWY